MNHLLPALAEADPGVYAVAPDGTLRQIHLHQGGEYALTDIIEFFELGTAIEELAVDILEFNRQELRTLKTMADAYSFDYPQEYIEMCLEIHRGAEGLDGDLVRFYGNF